MKIKIKSRKPILRLVSVLIGAGLWLYVLSAARVRVDKVVMLQFILPENVVFAGRAPSEVTVTLEGPSAFMRELETREEKMVIDLNRHPWRNQLRPHVTLRGNELNLPFGVKVEKILPRTLSLRLERKTSKIVPVRVPLVGTLPPELRIENAKVWPAEVEVVGPRSLIVPLKEVLTRPVEVESLLGREEMMLDWQLPDERLSVTSPTLARYNFKLIANKANLVLEDMVVRLMGEGRLVSVKKAQVILWAPPDFSRRVNKADLNVQVWAEVPEGTKKRTRVPLRVVLPPRLHLLEVRPKTVLVEGP